MRELKELFLVDSMLNLIIKFWNWLSGKKTYLAMGLLFVYGGLSYLGADLLWLKDAAMWLGGVGLVHGFFKGVVK